MKKKKKIHGYFTQANIDIQIYNVRGKKNLNNQPHEIPQNYISTLTFCVSSPYQQKNAPPHYLSSTFPVPVEAREILFHLSQQSVCLYKE